jgi:hypothetical protein
MPDLGKSFKEKRYVEGNNQLEEVIQSLSFSLNPIP